MKWIDIGVNLTNQRFDKDREAIIIAAQQTDIVAQIVTGTNLQESQQALQLSSQYTNQLFSTAGCHPHDAKNFEETHIRQIQAILEHDSVVAVGECGLDFNRDFSPRETQIKVFEQQLTLAVDCKKPLFLHERDAFETQLKLLKKYRSKLTGAVVHCFTGTKEQLLAYLDLDLHIGITGWICDERRGKALREIVHLIPEDRLMLETDAPYLLPRDMRPRPKSSRNLPQYLPHIGKAVAQLRDVDTVTLAEQCYQNTISFFGLTQLSDF
ncbi:MAG: TatD family hydrolase [Kangiellaceae bacterium]|nr:TatD family hydrolase [Kangiellaceae bacterium]